MLHSSNFRSNNNPLGHVSKVGTILMHLTYWLHEFSIATFLIMAKGEQLKHFTFCTQSHSWLSGLNKNGCGHVPGVTRLWWPQKKYDRQSLTSCWNDPGGRPLHSFCTTSDCCALTATKSRHNPTDICLIAKKN